MNNYYGFKTEGWRHMKSKNISGATRSFLLIAMIVLSAVQSSTTTLIHNAKKFKDTSTMLDTTSLVRYWETMFGDNF